jgi:hypothetical protein
MHLLGTEETVKQIRQATSSSSPHTFLIFFFCESTHFWFLRAGNVLLADRLRSQAAVTGNEIQIDVRNVGEPMHGGQEGSTRDVTVVLYCVLLCSCSLDHPAHGDEASGARRWPGRGGVSYLPAAVCHARWADGHHRMPDTDALPNGTFVVGLLAGALPTHACSHTCNLKVTHPCFVAYNTNFSGNKSLGLGTAKKVTRSWLTNPESTSGDLRFKSKC